MTVRIEWVEHGRPAARALCRAIGDAKKSEPLSPVTVVVPSNHVGVAARRLLASGRVGSVLGGDDAGVGLAAVTFLTVYRLGELLGAARLSGSGRRPVSTPLIAAALRAALAQEPGIFEPVADHPSTEEALVSAYRELRDVSRSALRSIARQSDRASDVVRLHLAARARLEPDWYDEEDLLDSAGSVLESGGARNAADELGAVVLYMPESVSRHAARFLRVLSTCSQLLVLAAVTGDDRADSEVFRSFRRLGGAEEAAPTREMDVLSVTNPATTRIVTTSDADEEVRAAVRAVVEAIDSGTALDRIAILYPSRDPYVRLVHEQLSAAGVKLNGPAVVPLAGRLAGRVLLGYLALPEGNFRRDDVFAWLSGARLRNDGHPIPVSAWERLSREAGVVAGRAHWDRLVARLAYDKEEEALRIEADPDEPSWRAEQARTSAARARDLHSFARKMIDDLDDAVSKAKSWQERSEWARSLLASMLGDPARRNWPVVEERAAERLERALDRLARLGAVEGPVDLQVFRRTLELELDADLGRVGRMGEGVLVAPITMGVGLDLDLVVILGLAEGTFPSAVKDDSLLPDREREAAGDELPRRGDQLQRQHRSLLAALATASKQVLCVPRGDLRRSQDRLPSRWIVDIASRFAGERWWSEQILAAESARSAGSAASWESGGSGTEGGTGTEGATGERAWLEHVASFDAGLRKVTRPVSEQEYRLRRLLSLESAKHSDPGASVWREVGDPALARGAEVLAARRSDLFTKFDGNLSGHAVPSPTARVTSATRLEGWAGCPFAYLLQDVLSVEDVENPEELLQISALDRGSLVHEVLERFVKEVLGRPEEDQPRPSDRWSLHDRQRMIEIAEEVCASYEEHGLTGRPIFWERDKRRIIGDLARFLDLDDAHRAGQGTRPIAAELAFGLRGSDLGVAVIQLSDGRSVDFRGMADRVDLAVDGTVHVVDYKTGALRGYVGLSEEDPDKRGTRLQLVVYGQAARQLLKDPKVPVIAEYWFVTSKGEYRRIGYPVTPRVLEHVGETLKTIVDGIETGVFPNFPTASSTSPFPECPYCDPDGLGVVELRRSWERKREDVALSGFAGLAESLDFEEVG